MNPHKQSIVRKQKQKALLDAAYNAGEQRAIQTLQDAGNDTARLVEEVREAGKREAYKEMMFQRYYNSNLSFPYWDRAMFAAELAAALRECTLKDIIFIQMQHTNWVGEAWPEAADLRESERFWKNPRGKFVKFDQRDFMSRESKYGLDKFMPSKYKLPNVAANLKKEFEALEQKIKSRPEYKNLGKALPSFRTFQDQLYFICRNSTMLRAYGVATSVEALRVWVPATKSKRTEARINALVKSEIELLKANARDAALPYVGMFQRKFDGRLRLERQKEKWAGLKPATICSNLKRLRETKKANVIATLQKLEADREAERIANLQKLQEVRAKRIANAREIFLKHQQCSVVINSCIRGWMVRLMMERKHAAAVTLQSAARMKLAKIFLHVLRKLKIGEETEPDDYGVLSEKFPSLLQSFPRQREQASIDGMLCAVGEWQLYEKLLGRLVPSVARHLPIDHPPNVPYLIWIAVILNFVIPHMSFIDLYSVVFAIVYVCPNGHSLSSIKMKDYAWLQMEVLRYSGYRLGDDNVRALLTASRAMMPEDYQGGLPLSHDELLMMCGNRESIVNVLKRVISNWAIEVGSKWGKREQEWIMQEQKIKDLEEELEEIEKAKVDAEHLAAEKDEIIKSLREDNSGKRKIETLEGELEETKRAKVNEQEWISQEQKIKDLEEELEEKEKARVDAEHSAAEKDLIIESLREDDPSKRKIETLEGELEETKRAKVNAEREAAEKDATIKSLREKVANLENERNSGYLTSI